MSKRNQIIKQNLIDKFIEAKAIHHTEDGTPIVTMSINELWGILAPMFGDACQRCKKAGYDKGWDDAYNEYFPRISS